MRKKVIAVTSIIIFLLLGYNFCYGAVIEIKDTKAQVLTGGTVSDFYVMGEGLRDSGQTLEGTNVDVKMANNYEWAVVSYFSNSAYGTAGSGQNSGINVNTGVKTHKSTNGNVTGVMDWGNTGTYTAGITKLYKEKTIVSDGNLTMDPTNSVILNNADTDRVDKFGTSVTDYSVASTGWYGSWNHYGGSYDQKPYSVRVGIFGFISGYHGTFNRTSGAAYSDVTFRPVFYPQ